jgi:hypothetical protein
MATRTWIGGGDNNASNPLDWNPNGVPQPGEQLSVVPAVPGTPQSFTMNVMENDLAGDPVDIVSRANLLANLSNRAVMTAVVSDGANGTFNLSQQSSLNLSLSSGRSGAPSNNTINLSQNSSLDLSAGGFGVTANVNMSGNDAAHIIVGGLGSANVTLQPGARWSGTVNTARGGFGVSGGPDSVFNNDGDSNIGQSFATIHADVAGKGNIAVRAFAHLEFASSVGPNQTVSLDSAGVQIDQPNLFEATATLITASTRIDLIGLAEADSYTFKNDLLSIFSGKSIIDTLRLHDSTPNGFVVQKDLDSVNILGISNPTSLPEGLLPLHSSV